MRRKRSLGVACAEKFCVCLTVPESQHCAVHLKHPMLRLERTDRPGAVVVCVDCYGTRKCEDCEGEGTHYCGHGNCNESHECRTCDGSGDCPSCCRRVLGKRPDATLEQRYVAWAFECYVPPPERPWEVEDAR